MIVVLGGCASEYRELCDVRYGVGYGVVWK